MATADFEISVISGRPITEIEAMQIIGLRRQLDPETEFVEGELEKSAEPPHVIIVAKNMDGVIVGMVFYAPYYPGTSACSCIWNLIVNESDRRKGIGRALIQKAAALTYVAEKGKVLAFAKDPESVLSRMGFSRGDGFYLELRASLGFEGVATPFLMAV